jgi:hypothetical protein
MLIRALGQLGETYTLSLSQALSTTGRLLRATEQGKKERKNGRKNEEEGIHLIVNLILILRIVRARAVAATAAVVIVRVEIQQEGDRTGSRRRECQGRH